MPNNAINLLHVHGEMIGYARYGTRLHSELEAQGIDVYDHLPGSDTEPQMSHLNEGLRSGIASTVCWVSVPAHARGWWANQRPVISTMWEATRLPEAFRENMRQFETVIVPSAHNVELFSQYHPNVKYVPLGIDPDIWQYRERTAPDRTFRFLIGGSGERKGTDLAVKAFQACFPDGSWGSGPMPVLQMKSPRGREFYGPRVEVIAGRLSAEDETNLYAGAHVYLQPSRGEGFGLQPLQAIAQGCPTILTDAHGHTAFSHLGMGLGYTYSQTAYFVYGDAGQWWEPSFDDLCDWMLYSYENYDEVAATAKLNSEVAHAEFTWAQCGTRFVDALGGIDALTECATPGAWFEPPVDKYLVVTNVDYYAEIGGIQYAFTKGVEYWELADVKRIMFEAERLDPVCLPPLLSHERDCGLTDSQLERVPAYSAQFSRCQSCGHTLNCQACA